MVPVPDKGASTSATTLIHIYSVESTCEMIGFDFEIQETGVSPVVTVGGSACVFAPSLLRGSQRRLLCPAAFVLPGQVIVLQSIV